MCSLWKYESILSDDWFFCFSVLGFGFWVLGFGFWVLGFGFWFEDLVSVTLVLPKRLETLVARNKSERLMDLIDRAKNDFDELKDIGRGSICIFANENDAKDSSKQLQKSLFVTQDQYYITGMK